MRLIVVPFALVALVASAACGSGDASSSSGGQSTDAPVGDDTSVSGTVIAPTEAAATSELPAGSQLVIRLEDISLADAPSVVVAEQKVDLADNDFPVGFVLDYDDGDIDDRNLYRVSARVEASGDLVMISDTVIPVITRGAPTTNIEVPLILVASN